MNAIVLVWVSVCVCLFSRMQICVIVRGRGSLCGSLCVVVVMYLFVCEFVCASACAVVRLSAFVCVRVRVLVDRRACCDCVHVIGCVYDCLCCRVCV